jgi:hypothetical protein
VAGTASGATGTTYGVKGDAVSTDGYGVHGSNAGTTGNSMGVYGSSASTAGIGVKGEATTSTGANFGVYGATGSAAGYAGYFAGDLLCTQPSLFMMGVEDVLSTDWLWTMTDGVSGQRAWNSTTTADYLNFDSNMPGTFFGLTGYVDTMWIYLDIDAADDTLFLDLFAQNPAGMIRTGFGDTDTICGITAPTRWELHKDISDLDDYGDWFAKVWTSAAVDSADIKIQALQAQVRYIK